MSDTLDAPTVEDYAFWIWGVLIFVLLLEVIWVIVTGHFVPDL